MNAPGGDAPVIEKAGRRPGARARVPAARDRRMARGGALAVVGAMLLAAAWASSGPLGSAPDEEAHIVYAYGLATGQTLPGAERTVVVDRAPQTTVQIPTELLRFPDRDCYAFAVGVPAECPATVRAGTGTETTTYMSRYPPTYYLIAGTAMRAGMWAGLPGPTTLWLVRMLSGVVCLGLVLLAVRTLARRLPPRAAATAAVVVCTPTALALFSSINPNGFEIASAVLVSALVAAIRTDVGAGRPVAVRTQVALLVAVVLLAGSRPMGVVWAGAAALLLLLPTAGTRIVPLRRLRWWTVVVGGAALAVALAWIRYAQQFRGAENGVGDTWQGTEPVGRVVLIVLQLGDMLRTAMSVSGWGEVVLPAIAVDGLVVVSTALLVAQLAGRRPGEPRAASALAFLTVSTLALGVQSYRDAFGWQGRYWLPVLTAAVVLLVPAMHGRAVDGRGGNRSLLVGVVLLLGTGGLALAWNVLRYAHGIGYVEGRFPPVPRIDEPAAWAPPGGVLLVLGLWLGGAALVAVAFAHTLPPAGAGARTSPEPSGAPTA